MCQKLSKSKGKVLNRVSGKTKCFVDDGKATSSSRCCKSVLVRKLRIVIDE
jgi:hypothetical protein